MKNKSHASLLFDICWFISFGVIYCLPFIFAKRGLFPFDFLALVCLVGTSMIYSTKINDFSIVGKMLYWIAINIFKPRTKHNHLIWGSFILGMGLLAALFGKRPDQNEIAFFDRVNSSYEFWIGCIVVLALNILVGIYTAKKHKND